MTPHAFTLLPKSDVEMWQRIRKSIEALPDLDLGPDEFDRRVLISCRMLARAVSNVFGLEFRDGYFVSPGFNHSWVVTPEKNIIDVYPVGILGGPILVDESVSRISNIYVALSPEILARRYGAMLNTTWFNRAVEKVTEEIRKVQPAS